MLLVNNPVPVPSEVFGSEIVGSDDGLQQIPLAVTAAFPSELIFPPLLAVVEVMDDTVDVDNKGSVTVSAFLHPDII